MHPADTPSADTPGAIKRRHSQQIANNATDDRLDSFGSFADRGLERTYRAYELDEPHRRRIQRRMVIIGVAVWALWGQNESMLTEAHTAWYWLVRVGLGIHFMATAACMRWQPGFWPGPGAPARGRWRLLGADQSDLLVGTGFVLLQAGVVLNGIMVYEGNVVLTRHEINKSDEVRWGSALLCCYTACVAWAPFSECAHRRKRQRLLLLVFALGGGPLLRAPHVSVSGIKFLRCYSAQPWASKACAGAAGFAGRSDPSAARVRGAVH